MKTVDEESERRKQEQTRKWHAENLDPGEVTETFNRTGEPIDLWPSPADEAGAQDAREALIETGRLLLIPDGVPVKVLKVESRSGSSVSLRRQVCLVEVLEGKFKGATGWVHILYLKQPNDPRERLESR